MGLHLEGKFVGADPGIEFAVPVRTFLMPTIACLEIVEDEPLLAGTHARREV